MTLGLRSLGLVLLGFVPLWFVLLGLGCFGPNELEDSLGNGNAIFCSQAFLTGLDY